MTEETALAVRTDAPPVGKDNSLEAALVAETTARPTLDSRPVGEGASAAASAAPKTYDEAYVKSLRAEAAGYRVRLKELEAADSSRRSHEEAHGMAEASEVERLRAQLAESEQRARSLEINGIRAAAALSHGLPEDLHEFITADDEAAANAQAVKLASRLPAGGGQAPTLPLAGGRNPANSGEQAARLEEKQRFDTMRRKVPALNSRVIRD